jgi:hypothetical protein
MNDLRYLRAKDVFLDRAYLGLREHFPSRGDFDKYFDAINGDEQKDLFLRTSLFYVLLVKCGDWVVDVPGSDKVVDYLTNTYKFVAIFSLIESLSEENFIDFYQFLVRQSSQVEFPSISESQKHNQRLEKDLRPGRCARRSRPLSLTR